MGITNYLPGGWGQMIAVPGAGFPITLVLQNWGGFTVRNAILTALGIDEKCNFQVIHTLRDFIYVYSFGDRVGNIILSGYAATGECGGPALTTGLESVYSYYRRYRLANMGQPVQVTIGATMVFSCILVSVHHGFQDPNSGLSVFTMELLYPPQQATIASSIENSFSSQSSSSSSASNSQSQSSSKNGSSSPILFPGSSVSVPPLGGPIQGQGSSGGVTLLNPIQGSQVPLLNPIQARNQSVLGNTINSGSLLTLGSLLGA